LWQLIVGLAMTRMHCALAGHDDRIVRGADRLFLCCSECGRATPGWAIAAGGPSVTSRLPGRPHVPQLARVASSRSVRRPIQLITRIKGA
jgi:hypothetical protein